MMQIKMSPLGQAIHLLLVAIDDNPTSPGAMINSNAIRHLILLEFERTWESVVPDPMGTGRIPPVADDGGIPHGTHCQEASHISHERYIPCGKPATSIVEQDGRGYYMCTPCADHNLRNRGGRLIATLEREIEIRYGGRGGAR